MVLIATGSTLLALLVLLIVLLLVLAHRERVIKRDANGLQADLHAAEQALNGARSGGADQRLRAADTALATLLQHTATLHRETSGPLWTVGSLVPGLRRPLLAVHDLADVTDSIAGQILPHDITTLDELGHQNVATGLDLRPLQARAAQFARDTTVVDAAVKTVYDIRPTHVRAIDQARNQVLSGVVELAGYTHTLAVAAHAAPEILGTDGPRRTLIILQTPAEARGSGGFVGGYIELLADHGTITVTATGGNQSLFAHNATAPVLTPDPQFQALYGTRYATTDWRDSNLSPDFTQVAPIWAALYRQATGHSVDGVIGMTPEALGRILAVTGPVDGPEGLQLSASNAADVLEKGIYARYPAADSAVDAERDAYQVSILRSVVTRLLAYRGDPLPLLSALGQGTDAGEVRLFSTDPADQSWIATTPAAGDLGSAPGPFYGAIVINDDTTKLDVYLRRSTSYRRTAVPGDKAHQRVTLTVRLTNRAPRSGLPAYVTFRADFATQAERDRTPAGTHHVLLDLYLATGARMLALDVDGRSQHPALQGRERDHLFVEAVPPDLAPGASATVTLTAIEPTSSATPVVLAQAGSSAG